MTKSGAPPKNILKQFGNIFDEMHFPKFFGPRSKPEPQPDNIS